VAAAALLQGGSRRLRIDGGRRIIKSSRAAGAVTRFPTWEVAQMADTPLPDAEAESRARAERSHASHRVDPEAIRRRAYELSQLHPNATAEENWLLAESELVAAANDRLAAATEHDRREAESKAAETTAALMANLEMTVYGHS
jgi:hypothetical protein